MNYKNTRSKGNAAETIACNHLIGKNYQILERNYCILGGEIDIITKLKDEIIFVEVKSLQNENLKTLEETVSFNKKKYLIRACQRWLYKNKMQEIDWRIDFIGIILDNKQVKKLLHLENAIY